MGIEFVGTTEVVVSSHEKRNHPFGEFAHYDSNVSVTVELGPGLSSLQVESRIRDAQDRARALVLEDCDAWEQGIILQREVDEQANRLKRAILTVKNARYQSWVFSHVKDALLELKKLLIVSKDQGLYLTYREQLMDAWREACGKDLAWWEVA